MVQPLFIGFIILCFINTGDSQKIDYLHIRDSIALLSCGNQDRGMNLNAMHQLENYDVSLLGKHINMYYEDLAICYWKEAGLKNEELLRKGIQSNLNALYYKPDSQRALWGLTISYAYLNECPKALYYLEVLRKYTSKKKWDREQELAVLLKCN